MPYFYDIIFLFSGYASRNLHPIPIDSDNYLIISSDYKFDKIWNIVKKDAKSNIEKRLMNSIIWLGMAVGEINKSIAVMECVLAIESLIKITDDFLTKSIGAQLKEACAFILANEKEKRVEIDKIVGEMFVKRSSFAHGKSQEITDCDLDTYITLTRNLIISFNILNFSSIEEFSKFIEEKRYS